MTESAAWIMLENGREVPERIRVGHIVGGKRRRRALCFPDGTTYMRHKGIWEHYMRGYGEKFEPTQRRSRWARQPKT